MLAVNISLPYGQKKSFEPYGEIRNLNKYGDCVAV